jgi:hypothetical protein
METVDELDEGNQREKIRWTLVADSFRVLVSYKILEFERGGV